MTMRWTFLLTAMLLTGSLGTLNSPGSAEDPLLAAEADLRDYVYVADEMHTRWQALDSRCDPDAIFSLLYLITTAAVGDLVAAQHFEDNPMLVSWDAEFAGRYFAAYDAYHAGLPTPGPWRVAFEHADSGNSTVTEDLLLGMNAHVNYDLAMSAYAMGLPQEGRKADFDRVNDAFWNVPIPQSNEFNKRYQDGGQRDPNGELSLADQVIVEMLISWREGAWANAQALAAAPTSLARDLVAASIEAEATAAALVIAQNDEDTSAQRIARCEASGHPPLPADIGGPGYGDGWFDEAFSDPSFLICHRPGTSDEGTMRANQHSWKGHAHHGDSKGAC